MITKIEMSKLVIGVHYIIAELDKCLTKINELRMFGPKRFWSRSLWCFKILSTKFIDLNNTDYYV